MSRWCRDDVAPSTTAHQRFFRRKSKAILKYIKLSVFTNTIERLRENNDTARSEAWFTYRHDEASNPRSQIYRKFPTVQKHSRVPGLKYSRARAHMYLSRYAWHLVSWLRNGGIWEHAKFQVRMCVCTPVPSWLNFPKYTSRKIYVEIIVNEGQTNISQKFAAKEPVINLRSTQ